MTKDQIASALLSAARSAVATTLGERAAVVWPLVEPEARQAAENAARELLEVVAPAGTKARTVPKSAVLNEPKPRNPRSFPSAPSIQARWYNSRADTAPWLYFGDPADLQFRAYVTWKGLSSVATSKRPSFARGSRASEARANVCRPARFVVVTCLPTWRRASS